MTSPNVVVVGAGGQLGRTLMEDWSRVFSTTDKAGNTSGNPDSKCPVLIGLSRETLDVCQPDTIEAALKPLQPDVLINTAAWTKVDLAEQARDEALRVNRDGAANLAAWARRNSCRLIHLSTDFVFDGASSRAYRPDDPTTPLGVYGESKLAGERAVLETHPGGSLIFRTSWLYSRHAPNFVITMLKLMRERESLRVVVDQLGTPTSTHSLVEVLAEAVKRGVPGGIYHWSDAGVASWYDFAVAIQELSLDNGLLDCAIPIEPVDSTQFPTPAQRPAFSVLDKSATYAEFVRPAVHWRVELKRVIEELEQLENTANKRQ